MNSVKNNSEMSGDSDTEFIFSSESTIDDSGDDKSFNIEKAPKERGKRSRYEYSSEESNVTPKKRARKTR